MNESSKSTKLEHPAQIESKRRELWIYMGVSIATVEILILVGALVYGFISGHSKGSYKLIFPWLSWGAVSLFVPSIMLLGVHLAGVGLFLSSTSKEDYEEWQKHLPQKLQKVYKAIAKAPAVVLVVGVAVLAVAIFTLDGAIGVIESTFETLRPYLLHILAGLGGICIIFALIGAWLNYRTKRLYAEYEYRREVFEKTGLIITDKNSVILQANHGQSYIPLTTASASQNALPQGHIIDTVSTVVTESKEGEIDDADVSSVKEDTPT